jgi:hypothetical protein
MFDWALYFSDSPEAARRKTSPGAYPMIDPDVDLGRALVA